MAQHPLSELMETTMQKIRELVDSETIIGEPMVISEQITLIPISKMAFGFASGGADFNNKENQNLHFGGGSGAGVTVSPVGFITISGGTEVSFVPMTAPSGGGTLDNIVAGLPDLIQKFKTVFTKEKEEIVRDEIKEQGKEKE